MAKKPLTERQLEVLRWIAKGCPAGAWDENDFAYKISAQALQNRGLVKIARRAGVWSVEVTAPGRHYLEHGTYLAHTARQEHSVRHTRAKAPAATSVTAQSAPPQTLTPGKPTAPEAVARPSPRRRTTAKQPRKTLGEQLIDDVLAAGGSLVIKQEYGAGAPNWTARIRSAQQCGKLPEGKEMVYRWRAGGYEITIQDMPAWKLAVLNPIAVPERLHRPHAIVATLRDGEPALGLSKSVQPRALRLVQAIVTEAEHRGHTVRLARGEHAGHRSRRSDAEGLFTVTAQGQSCGFCLGQERDMIEHVPTAKELDDAERYSWVKVSKYDYAPSDRLTITLNGGITHRRSVWKDTADHPLEDQLPQILQEVDLRGQAAERKRAEEEEQARLKRRQWEAAIRQAHHDYAEAFRIRVLEQQQKAWQQATQLSTYLTAVNERIEAMPQGTERTEAEAWLSWATHHARSLDPLTRPLRMPEVPDPRPSDLEPFLHGWSPYGPHGR
ncbi:hypothetical protein [Streptomyces sp. NPDC101234]|uniref:hypothetical protein n=1 Tax=Streptomyces sp. NPDC101234 TaxID=3366138 RepID=UPI00382B27C3